jgi:hypothetical protein
MVEPGTGLPGRYSIFGTEGYPYTDFDHGAILTNDQVAAIAARCVFLRCDQPGAFGCADAFRCDVANALPLSSGCVGIPCGELGRCSTDAFICEPTSTGPRPVTVDAHGCVEKNCEEGRPCAELYRCDAARTTNVDGCVPIRCDEPGGACVSELTKCAPDYVREQLPSGLVYAPDAFGCVYKRCDIDDFPCPAGQVCDPATSRSTDGCTAPPVPPDPGGGGTSGTAGTSGTSGTSGVAGTTGDPSPSGVCR